MKQLFQSFLMLLLLSAPAQAAVSTENGNVLVSIAPIHSLTQSVLGDTETAHLLVEGKQSPHGFSLKPSHMRMINDADLLIYIDDAFEIFIAHALESQPQKQTLQLAKSSAITMLPARAGGIWEIHDHHDEEEHKNEAHEHHEHEEHANATQEVVLDYHIWLSPDNAAKMVQAIEKKLSARKPENAAIYHKNAAVTIEKLKTLKSTIANNLKPVQASPYIVFHDAYQYFNQAFQLNGVGSITFEPNESPSVERIKEIRKKIKDSGAMCVFHEPQFSDKLVKTVMEGSQSNAGTLDPLGSVIANGADLYVGLLTNLSRDFTACVKPKK